MKDDGIDEAYTICSSRVASFQDPNDDANDVHDAFTEAKKNPMHIEETANIKTSDQKCNGSSLNDSSHHSSRVLDNEPFPEDDSADDILELDTDDLVVQDECCDEEVREKPRRIRSKSETSVNIPVKLRIKQRRHCSSSPINYTPPKPVTCGESAQIEGLMHRAQFFLAKSCRENIRIAKEKSLWTTTRSIEKLIGEAFYKASVVILIFLARSADHFSGFAKVCSQALYKGQPAVRWKDFSGGGNIKIKWISKCSLDLKATKNIKNSFNKEREVYVGQDGCEIQRTAGQKLCSLFPFDDTVDIFALRSKDEAKKIPRKRSHSTSPKKFFHSSSRMVLPSLFENRVSYTQFKRAKRDLSFEELYEKIRRDELRLLLESSSAFRSYSRRSLLPEAPRSLLYDALSKPQPGHLSYRLRERSPIPSLLDGVAKFSSHSMPQRPIRLLDEIRGASKHFEVSSRRRESPRRIGREREREIPGTSKSSRSLRDERSLRNSKEGSHLRRSSERKEAKHQTLRRNIDSSSQNKHVRTPEKSSRSSVKETDKYRQRHEH